MFLCGLPAADAISALRACAAPWKGFIKQVLVFWKKYLYLQTEPEKSARGLWERDISREVWAAWASRAEGFMEQDHDSGLSPYRSLAFMIMLGTSEPHLFFMDVLKCKWLIWSQL